MKREWVLCPSNPLMLGVSAVRCSFAVAILFSHKFHKSLVTKESVATSSHVFFPFLQFGGKSFISYTIIDIFSDIIIAVNITVNITLLSEIR